MTKSTTKPREPDPERVVTGSKKTAAKAPDPSPKKNQSRTRASAKTTSPAPTASSAAANTVKSEAPLGPNGHPLLSLSKLAEYCDIDRSVARKKLHAAKIKPDRSEAKLKLYELSPEVEDLLSESGNPKLDEVKLREAEASARLKELKVDRESGRLVDFDEACDTFGKAIKGLYDRLKVDYPPKAGPRLHKLKTGRDITAALRRDFDKIFGEFRSDFRRFIR